MIIKKSPTGKHLFQMATEDLIFFFGGGSHLTKETVSDEDVHCT
jgi:hypothetical protein